MERACVSTRDAGSSGHPNSHSIHSLDQYGRIEQAKGKAPAAGLHVDAEKTQLAIAPVRGSLREGNIRRVKKEGKSK